MTSKRTIRAIAGFACTAALLVAAPVASAQTGGIPGGTGGTTTEPTAQPSSAPGSWTVHKAATWYGPGLYGNEMACGGKLTRNTFGVAHKSLPCGTKVTIAHGGRIVIARVVDRGPFTKGVEYDLTAHTAEALRMSSTSEIRANR